MDMRLSIITILFSGLSVLFFADLHGQSCSADFFFQYQNDSLVVFYDRSQNATIREWDFGPGEIVEEDGSVFRVRLPEDSLQVCLYVSSPEGCEDSLCLMIYPGAPGEMCQVTDCIYPGDANGDRQANHLDVLSIGIGYGTAGPLRPFYLHPEDPFAWAPHYTPNWEQWLGVVNFKHLDCDGNGFIEPEDLDIIRYNYYPNQSRLNYHLPTAPSIGLDYSLEIVPDEQGEPDRFVVQGNITAGNPDHSFTALHGMAFTARLKPEYTPFVQFQLEAPSSGILGESLEFLERLPLERYDYAVTQPGGVGTSKSGVITSFNLVISADIIGGVVDEQQPEIELLLKDMILVDKTGQRLFYDMPSDLFRIVLDQGQVTADEELNNDPRIEVFPNPSSDYTLIRLTELRGERLELFDLAGRRILETPVRTNTVQINTSTLEAGVYWLNITTDEGRVRRKLVVQ